MNLDEFTLAGYHATMLNLSPVGQQNVQLTGLVLERSKIKIEFIPEYRERCWSVAVCIPVNREGFKRVDYLGTAYYSLSGSKKIAELVHDQNIESILKRIENSTDLTKTTLEKNLEDILNVSNLIVVSLQGAIPVSAVWTPPVDPNLFYGSQLKNLKKLK